MNLAPVTALAAGLVSAAAAMATELPPYLDDRSDLASIIRSYYNAVTRHEYARAWSYFGDTKPVADYPTFVAGYADTASVDVLLGPVTTEGAAGSTFATVPIAIAAIGADGSIRAYAGCYSTRQNPGRHPGTPVPPAGNRRRRPLARRRPACGCTSHRVLALIGSKVRLTARA